MKRETFIGQRVGRFGGMIDAGHAVVATGCVVTINHLLTSCVHNETFGCDFGAGGHHYVWVAGGCRAAFRCNEHNIGVCGQRKSAIAYELARCSCAENESARRTINAALRREDEAPEQRLRPDIFDLPRGVVDIGSCGAVTSFLSRLHAGARVSIVLFGGSSATGAGLSRREEIFGEIFASHLRTAFGADARLYNAGLGSSGSDYWAHCSSAHIPVEAHVDLILGEFAVNDQNSDAFGPRAYAPHETSTVTTLLATLAALSEPTTLLVSTNFLSNHPDTACASGLNLPGYRSMYSSHGIPTLSVLDAVREPDRCRSLHARAPGLWTLDHHPGPLMHAALGAIAVDWLRQANVSCGAGSGEREAHPRAHSLGNLAPAAAVTAAALTNDDCIGCSHDARGLGSNGVGHGVDSAVPSDEASIWRDRAPLTGPLACSTTLAPRAPGAFLRPFLPSRGEFCNRSTSGASVASAVPSTYSSDGDTFEYGVATCDEVPGWALSSGARGSEAFEMATPVESIRRDIKYRWLPTTAGAPIYFRVLVARAAGLVGLVFFCDATYLGSFNATLLHTHAASSRPHPNDAFSTVGPLRLGREACPTRQLVARFSFRILKSALVCTRVPRGTYLLRIVPSRKGAVGIVGVSQSAHAPA